MKHSLVSLALFKKYLFGFIYLVLTVLSLHCYTSFSLVAASRGCALTAMLGLLLLQSLGSREHGLQ